MRNYRFTSMFYDLFVLIHVLFLARKPRKQKKEGIGIMSSAWCPMALWIRWYMEYVLISRHNYCILLVRFLFPKSQNFIDWHLFKATLSVLGLIFTKTWKSADTVNRAIFTLFQPAILSSPKQSCVKWGVFLTFEFAQSLIRPLTIKAKEAKLKRGRTFPSIQ